MKTPERRMELRTEQRALKARRKTLIAQRDLLAVESRRCLRRIMRITEILKGDVADE